MCTFAKRCVWTALLFSCLLYGFGIEEALCAEPTVRGTSHVQAGGAEHPSVSELPPEWPKFTAKKVSFKEAHLEPLSAPELTKRLTAAQSILKHSIVKTKTHSTWWNDCRNSAQRRDQTGRMDEDVEMEIRLDGQRCAVRWRSWGNKGVPIQRRESWKPEICYFSYLWDGTRFYLYSCSELTPPGNVRIREGVTFSDTSVFQTDAEMRGCYDSVPIEFVLPTARSVKPRTELEEVGGSPCYVLDADTVDGKYVLWLDPAHGYHIARAERTKRKGDLSGAFRVPWPEKVKEKKTVETIQFAEVDGVWVPMECEVRFEWTWPDEKSSMLARHKRTEVKLKPDFDALRSFLPDDIKEGAMAEVHTAPNGPFGDKEDWGFWKNGSLVPSAETIEAKAWSHAKKVGDLVPDFTVKTLDGKEFRLSNHRGKVVLLHFCSTLDTAGLPGLKKWYHGLEGYRDHFAMISLYQDPFDDPIRRQVDQYGLTWPQARVGNKLLMMQDYGVQGIPAFTFIGPDGKIIPSDETSVMTILKALKAHGARKAPSPGSPGPADSGGLVKGKGSDTK